MSAGVVSPVASVDELVGHGDSFDVCEAVSVGNMQPSSECVASSANVQIGETEALSVCGASSAWMQCPPSKRMRLYKKTVESELIRTPNENSNNDSIK